MARQSLRLNRAQAKVKPDLPDFSTVYPQLSPLISGINGVREMLNRGNGAEGYDLNNDGQ